MRWLSALRLSLRSIVRNPVRSALTVLGMLIGVASLVAVVGLSSSATARIEGSISDWGVNSMYVQPRASQASGVRGKSGGRLTDADMRAIVAEAGSVAKASSVLTTLAQVVAFEQNVNTTVYGVHAAYLDIVGRDVARGRSWSATDESTKRKVVLIGQTVATALFAGGDPIGAMLRIGGVPYEVLGVLGAKGTSVFGEDQDDCVILPIGAFRARVRRSAAERADYLLLSATSPQTTEQAKRQVEELLRQRHGIRDGERDDFQVTTQAEFQAMQQSITSAMALLLLGVSAVSLVVGGIGVMNIMLVSVAERTREIGVRMSIGAREGDILWQFLVEAMVLTSLGGVAGALLGVSATALASTAMGWGASPPFAGLAVGLAVSAAMGLSFGYLPARRAASMDPIDALRSE